MDIKEIAELQRSFDCERGWNRYEGLETLEEILDFMQHFVLVMVEELGEVSRIRKQVLRDKKKLKMAQLKDEIVDLFVYLMQASMALDMDLEEQFLRKMKESEERFPAKRK